MREFGKQRLPLRVHEKPHEYWRFNDAAVM